jgi:hypothetical protein
MKFKTTCNVPTLPVSMDHRHRIVALGSCFAQNVGEQLAAHKFDVRVNPFGITYNPVSLVEQCRLALSDALPDEALFVKGLDDAYYHYDYHSDVTAIDMAKWLSEYRAISRSYADRLKTADWCIVTLGTAWVYTIGERVVANCHKQPSSLFTKRLLGVTECVKVIQRLVDLLPDSCQVLLTVSPVRHVRDGLVDNNRSKARLIEAVHQVVSDHSQVHYFPAYELVIDDLRDYRYFGEDLVHPTAMAVGYVWSQLVEAVMTDDSKAIIAQATKIRQAMRHRPRWEGSQQHQDFKASMLAKVEALAAAHPHLDWYDEINYFSADQKG